MWRRALLLPSLPLALASGGEGRCEHFAVVLKLSPKSLTPFDTSISFRARSFSARHLSSTHPAPMRGAFRERHERGAGCDGRLQCFELVTLWRLGFALHDRQELTSACRQSDLSAPRAQVLRARKLANRKVGPLRGSNSRGAASPLGDRVRSAGEGCIRGNYQSIPVHPKWCTGLRAHVDARRSAHPPRV